MIRATLTYKNGNKVTVIIPKMVQFIDVSPNDLISSGVEEFVDLTPDSIIRKGGFTEVEELKPLIIRFELCGNMPGFGTNDKNLYYEEI
jgi:hypothetical protein